MAVWLVVVLSFVSCVLSQAPGDGDPVCIQAVVDGITSPFFPLHPTYPANERPLMDSRDYTGLLQGGNPPVWQQVDNDQNNTAEDATNWIQQGAVICQGTVVACGFSIGAQENWLITQHISRELAGGQRLQKVTARFDFQLNGCDVSRQCKQSFDVYKWQTSTINREAARTIGNYARVGRVSPADTSGTVVTSETLDIELTAESGFHMAVMDLGTCIFIERILVFYYVCPAETSELITRPETISPESPVNGECVENSSPQIGSNPVLRCADKGVWEVIIPCQCNPGYEGVTEEAALVGCSECSVGTYSEGLGNEECVVCPPNSDATQTGLTQCTCVQDYYRAPNEGPSVACTQSPSAPVNVSVSNVTNTSVILSWLPPEDGGGRDLSEIHYTITARDTNGGGTTVRVIDVMGTEGQVQGLTPGVLVYTFSVTAENAVSSQDSDINARTTNTTATTEEGVAGTVSDIPEPDSGSTVVSWSPPVPPNGVILYYNVRISNADNGELILLVIELYDTEIDLDEHNIPDGMVTVEVQAVTSVGAGNFSSPVTISPGMDSEKSQPNSTTIGLGVGISILIVCLGVVTAIFFIYTYLSKRKKKTCKVDTSQDYEIPDPVFTPSSPPPLPVQPPPLPLQDNPAYGKVPPPLPTQDNPAYGKVSPQELSMTDNEAYGVVH